MKTLKIKAPTAELQIPPKVWIPILVALLGTLLFLYFRFKLKKKKRLAEAQEKEAQKEIAEKVTTEKVEEKETKPVVKKEEVEDIDTQMEDITQTVLAQNVHLPTLSFNNDWELIPLLPTAEHPIRYRIFNQTGQAAVEVSLQKAEEVTWQVTAENLVDVSVPLQDATQLRAVIASYLQQISPVSEEEE